MDKLIKNNLAVKILALLLAIMLWMVVNQERLFVKNASGDVADVTSREIKRVPVSGHLPSEEFVILDMKESIDIVLRGSSAILETITADSYEVYVDLSGLGEGKHNVPVQTKGFPTGVSVELRPATIEVTLEAKEVKEMPVAVEIVGAPREGYTVGTPIIDPPMVKVKAARSLLEKASVAKVFINIGDAVEDIRRPISLKVIDANNNEIAAEIEPETVDITVAITPPSKSISITPTISGEIPNGYAIAGIETDVSTVTVYGPLEVLNTLSTLSLPDTNVDGLNRTQSMTVVLSEMGISGVQRIEPAEVTITVRIVPSEVKTLEKQIEVIGLSEEDEVTFLSLFNGKMVVTLEGAPEVLNHVTDRNIRGTIDVSGLTHGEYELPIKWSIPEYTKLTKDIPRTVQIRITDRTQETSTTPEAPKEDIGEGTPSSDEEGNTQP